MRRIQQSQVEAVLEAAGLGSGSHVMVHSDLLRFGLPETGIATYRDAFSRVLGPTGTLATPAFSFSFIGSGTYHWANTPSEQMGALAESVRIDPAAKRTRHPIQSVALVGHHADALAAIETSSSYEDSGVFQAMCHLDFQLMTLGAGPIHLSHSHLSEELAEVPYRYAKWVSGAAELAGGEPSITKDWMFFARDLEIDARPEGEDHIVAELEAQGNWIQASLNDVPVHAGPAKTFVERLSAKLADDPLWMIPASDRDRVAALLAARSAKA